MPFNPKNAVLEGPRENIRFNPTSAVLEETQQPAERKIGPAKLFFAPPPKAQAPDVFDIISGQTPRQTAESGHWIAAGLQQTAKDILTMPIHAGNQYLANLPRSTFNTLGENLPTEAQSLAGQIANRAAGAAGMVYGIPTKLAVGGINLLSKQFPKVILPASKAFTGKISQRVATGAAGGLIGGATTAPETLDAKKYGEQIALSSVLGAAFPEVGNFVGTQIQKYARTSKQKMADVIDKNAKVYQWLLRPYKSVIQNVEIKSKKDMNKFYKLAAQEKLIIKRAPDNSRDTREAVQQIKNRIIDRQSRLRPILERDKTKRFSLAEIGYKAQVALRKQYKNDTDYKNAVNHVFEYIGDAIEERGNNIDAISLDNFKSGMWAVGYDKSAPNKNKAARQLGYFAKMAIEDAFKDKRIKILNSQIGNYSTLIDILESVHGAPVVGGRLGHYVARGAGTVIGSAAGQAVPIPGVGPVAGGILGNQIGGRVADIVYDPKRITEGLQRKIRRANFKESFGAPQIRQGIKKAEEFINRRAEEGERTILGVGTKIRSKRGVLDYSPVKAVQSPLGFYSKAEQSLIDLPMQKMTGPQLGAMLQKSGVKADEMAWTGLDDLIKKPSVTKQEALDTWRANQVKVKEKVLDNTQIKFSEYQLPGGDNYREVLLKLPAPRWEERALFKLRPMGNGNWEVTKKDTGDFVGQYPSRQEAQQAISTRDNRPIPFTSSHFDEPNILAHVRVNDRMVDGKKVLFIEEVQSDWHQKGRKEGYGKAPSPDTAGWTAFKNPYAPDKEWVVRRPNGENGYVSTADASTPEEAIIFSQSATQDFRGRNRVPDAPFKKTWHELAMKRMMKYSVDNGYDSIAWTTGEQQAARYDLSKQVEKIEWSSLKDIRSGRKRVDIYPKDHSTITVNVNKNGVVETIRGQGEFEGEKLEDVIGKDIAERINKEDIGVLKGDGLKVGGKGMAGFYDKILPSSVENLGKKWGIKVKQIKLDTGAEVHAIDLPDFMRSQVKDSGFPLFSLNPLVLGAGASVAAGTAATNANAQEQRRIIRRK